MGADTGFSNVVVVGLGLIGGSIVKALHGSVPVLAVEPDEASAESARRDGVHVVATLDAGLDAVDARSLIVVAVPVPVVASVFDALAARSISALVTDVASVKAPIVTAARRAGLRFVGGHPMAGSEHSGYDASSASLFSGARWALALDDTHALSDVVALSKWIIGLGAGVVPVEADDHDRAVALVSHLPHVFAAQLAASAESGGEITIGLAAGSFRDGTRVARSSPAFWTGILDANAEAVAPLLRRTAAELTAMAAALDAGDEAVVTDVFERGSAARRHFDERATTPLSVALDGPDAIAALLDLGRRGGFVAGFDDDGDVPIAHVRIPNAR